MPYTYSSLFIRKFYYILKFLKAKNKFNYFNKYKNNNCYIDYGTASIKLTKKIALYASF